MKLLVVTSLKEFQHDVSKMLDDAGVQVFSVTETVGYKKAHQSEFLSKWYGSGEGKFDSIFFFSFTDTETAVKALAMITACNAESKTRFPVRGFVMPVEQWS